jgi:membrane protein YqaA with SNARE-associated domain
MVDNSRHIKTERNLEVDEIPDILPAAAGRFRVRFRVRVIFACWARADIHAKIQLWLKGYTSSHKI